MVFYKMHPACHRALQNQPLKGRSKPAIFEADYFIQ
jgi:hypothetical protein